MAGITQCGLCGDLYYAHEEHHDCPELKGNRYAVVERARFDRVCEALRSSLALLHWPDEEDPAPCEAWYSTIEAVQPGDLDPLP